MDRLKIVIDRLLALAAWCTRWWNPPADGSAKAVASGTRRTRDNIVRALVPTRADARDVMQEVTFLRDRASDWHVFGDDVLALLADEAGARGCGLHAGCPKRCTGRLGRAIRHVTLFSARSGLSWFAPQSNVGSRSDPRQSVPIQTG